MPITFKDVAKLAGVSTQTVSRVTNGSESVSELTRFKVNQAIQTLGYVPHKGAQMLSRVNSKVIGILSLDIALQGAALITSGIREQAHLHGYSTALTMAEEPHINAIKQSVRELISQQASIIVINFPIQEADALLLIEQFKSCHLVFIDTPEHPLIERVCSQNIKGAEVAAQHLIDLGHQRFILLHGPCSSNAAQERKQGWINKLQQHNAVIVKQYQGDWTALSAFEAIQNAITSECKFDAVLVANDQMALGVLHALHRYQINVPSQVSVVGFDDTNESAFFNPSLTTIRQDFHLLGETAVKVALNQLQIKDQEGLAQSVAIPVKLIIRESSSASKQQYDRQEILKQLNRIKALLP